MAARCYQRSKCVPISLDIYKQEDGPGGPVLVYAVIGERSKLSETRADAETHGPRIQSPILIETQT